MGVDLTLLPFDYDDQHVCFSYTVLQVYRDYQLFEKIEKLNQFKVNENFRSFESKEDDFEELHCGKTILTPYGDALTYTTAGELKTCDIDGPTGAYIKALPDDNKVALFWR